MPRDLSLISSCADESFRTKLTAITYPRPNSAAHDTTIRLATVGLKRTKCDTLTGRGGLLGSTPGLFVGIGFCKPHKKPYYFTFINENKYWKTIKIYIIMLLFLQDSKLKKRQINGYREMETR